MQARLLCICACLGSAAVFCQDVVKVAPAGMVKVEYEDNQIRVLRFTEAPGSKLPMHSHPAYVAIGLSDDTSRYTFPDGKTADVASKAGGAEFSKAITHASENTSNATSQAILVELKNEPGGMAFSGEGDMVKTNPETCKVELDNEYARVTRVRLPPHASLAMHSHSGEGVVVYLSGGRTKTTTGDGKGEEAMIAPGTVRITKAITHSNENLGDEPTEAVMIELKTK